jgi:hypothetical protein
MAREYESRRIISPEKTILPAHTVYENFESGSVPGSSGTGTDWEAGRETWTVSRGKYSWRQRPKKTTPAADDYVYTTLYLPFYVSPRVDIDTLFLHRTANNNVYVRIEFLCSYNTKDTGFAPIIEFRCSDGRVRVRDENQAYQTVETVAPVGEGYWTIFGATVDLQNRKYVQVRVGQYKIDASAYSFYTLSTFYPCPIVNLFTCNVATDRALVYWDNISVFGYFA